MRLHRRLLIAAISGAAFATTGCASVQTGGAAAQTDATLPTAPALWKVADEDTTIYLFGTVHALPDGIDWLNGPVAAALQAAQTLVTEIPSDAMKDPANQAKFQTVAMLPSGKSLRDMLTPEQKASYEAALAKMDMPASAFDRVKPWFAAVTLGVLPLIKGGYAMENGVEGALESAAHAGMKHGALETVDDQIAAFDGLPMKAQVDYLMSVAEQIDEVVPVMGEMVAKWRVGDATGLARILNEEVDDPALAEALLYNRNRKWAGWIDKRLDQPGTVFIAVGAGHLAGKGSVQDYLAQSGITTQRVQ